MGFAPTLFRLEAGATVCYLQKRDPPHLLVPPKLHMGLLRVGVRAGGRTLIAALGTQRPVH